MAATLRARVAAPPHLDHDPGEHPARAADRRAVGGGARRLRLARLGPHRRPRRRQDRLHAGDRRRGGSGQRDDRPLRPDRARRPPARGSDRARGADDPPHARVDAGPRAGLPARPPAAGRPGDRRRVLDAEPAPGRGAAGRARRDDPRRPRRRRRPAAADRRRQAVRGPDRLRGGAGGAAEPDLPPGGALDDHHRRPRDQPRAGRRTCSRPRTRTTTSSSSTGPAPSGRWRRWSRSSPSGRRRASSVDPIRDVQVLAPMYKGAVGIDALNERLQARLNGDGKRGAERPLPDRRPPDPDPQLARAGADERLDRLPPLRRPRRRGDRRRHRRGRHPDHPLRRDRDAEAGLRDLGPQGPGLRGAGRGRRLPPLALADADPPPALHGDHPRPQQLRAGRRPGARWRRRCGATTAAAATPAWPSACAAERPPRSNVRLRLRGCSVRATSTQNW